jgi:hypothetical protein
VEIGKKAEAAVSGGTSSMQTQRQVTETCGDVFATANSGVEDKCMRKARKKIEAKQVEELAFIGSTLSEMAIFLNCSEETFYQRFHKAIKRGIVCRTIFLKRQRFDLAVKGNAAALKSWDAAVGEPNEQLNDLKHHEEQASLTEEELTVRILARDKVIEELLAKNPKMQELILAQRRSLQTKTPQTRLSHGTFVEQGLPLRTVS